VGRGVSDAGHVAQHGGEGIHEPVPVAEPLAQRSVQRGPAAVPLVRQASSSRMVKWAVIASEAIDGFHTSTKWRWGVACCPLTQVRPRTIARCGTRRTGTPPRAA
jgi:hypothetical protein